MTAIDRPLTIAEIFDRAVTVIVRRWSTAAAIALIASLPQVAQTALVASSATFVRREPFAFFVLELVYLVGLAFAFAALVLLFAGAEPGANALLLYRAAFASFWRILRVGFVDVFLTGVAVAIAVLLTFGLSAVAGIAGTIVGMVLGALAVIPIFFTLQLAFSGAVLEGTGAMNSIDAAFRRAFSRGARARTAKLSFAAILTYAGPNYIISGLLAYASLATGRTWLIVLASPLALATAFVFFTAVVTIAGIDYRVRAEGVDLEAALDVVESA